MRSPAPEAVEPRVQTCLRDRRREGPPYLPPEALQHANADGVVPRVVPLLCHELMTCSAVFLRLNLHAVTHYFDLLPRVVVTPEDAQHLLLVLFHLMSGPTNEGGAPIPPLAFACLCRLLGHPHAHSATFVEALKTLCRKLRLTEEGYYRRPPEGRLQATVRRRLVALNGRPTTPPPPTRESDVRKAFRAALEERRLFLKEIGAVRAVLTEDDFLDLRQGFRELDVEGKGHVRVDDLAAAGEEIAGRPFTVEMFKRAARGRSETITLREVLLALFPMLSPAMVDLFLEKAGKEPVHPDLIGRAKEVVEPQADYRVNRNATLLTPPQFLALRLGYEKLVGGNVRHRLRLPALMAGGEQIAGNAFTRDMFTETCLRHGHNGAIAFIDVLREWFPAIAEEDLRFHLAAPGWAEEEETDAAEDPDEALSEADTLQIPIPFGPQSPAVVVTPDTLRLDAFLEAAVTRYHCRRLLQTLDLAGVFVPGLVDPPKAHLYLPHLWTRQAKVFRDFITCPRRHRQPKPQDTPQAAIHIKTNIPAKGRVMYRFLVEGYNYGKNAAINSEIVGCTQWKGSAAANGDPEARGYPAGWNSASAVDHAAGAQISQYHSSDGFVVVQLSSKSFFNAGFGVSAWLVTHGFGADWHICATIHHQDDPL